MNPLILCVALAVGQVAVKPQPLPEWLRIYTFEDSFVEMNTDYVMFNDRRTARVRFRWSFIRPEELKIDSLVAYETRLEEIEWDCTRKQYRVYDVRSYNPQGRLQMEAVGGSPADWRAVRFGSVTEKLFVPACRLIERRRREPALER